MSALRKPELEIMSPAPARQVQEDREDYSADKVLLETWLSGRNVKTEAAYRSDAERFMRCIGIPLAELTELEQLRPWLHELSTLAPSTQRRAISAVRSLLKLGHGLGRLKCNIALALKLPKRGKVLPHVLERSEIIRVIESEKRPLRYLVLKGYYVHGWRVSELLGATWGDLSHKDGRWWLRVVGKGDLERDVPLSASFAASLLELRGDDAEPILDRTRQTVWRWVKELGLACGYPNLSTHWLRHCCCSHLLDAGTPPQEAKELLGHTSLATTTAYAHVQPQARPSERLEW